MPADSRTRSVRLDAEAEEALAEIQQATGMSISDALKRGLLAVRDELAAAPTTTPFGLYQSLDLGEGGYAAVPARLAKQGLREALRRKTGR